MTVTLDIYNGPNIIPSDTSDTRANAASNAVVPAVGKMFFYERRSHRILVPKFDSGWGFLKGSKQNNGEVWAFDKQGLPIHGYTMQNPVVLKERFLTSGGVVTQATYYCQSVEQGRKFNAVGPIDQVLFLNPDQADTMRNKLGKQSYAVLKSIFSALAYNQLRP